MQDKAPEPEANPGDQAPDLYESLRRYEQLTGRLLDATKARELQKHTDESFKKTLSKKCEWTDTQKAILRTIIEEQATATGNHDRVTFDDEGCPCPHGLGEIASQWSWELLFGFSSLHFTIMKFACCGHYLILESPFTFACELFFQHLSDDPKYRSLIGLPMVVAPRHVLRPTFGKRDQGQQKRSGWPLRPTCLADRVDKDNNMLIETWFENVIKQDYPEETHQVILEHLSKINIPKKWYDPDAPLPPELAAILEQGKIDEITPDYSNNVVEPYDGDEEANDRFLFCYAQSQRDIAAAEESEEEDDSLAQDQQDIAAVEEAEGEDIPLKTSCPLPFQTTSSKAQSLPFRTPSISVVSSTTDTLVADADTDWSEVESDVDRQLSTATMRPDSPLNMLSGIKARLQATTDCSEHVSDRFGYWLFKTFARITDLIRDGQLKERPLEIKALRQLAAAIDVQMNAFEGKLVIEQHKHVYAYTESILSGSFTTVVKVDFQAIEAAFEAANMLDNKGA